MKLYLLEYTSTKELQRQWEILSFLDYISKTAEVQHQRRKREGMDLKDLRHFMPELKPHDLTYMSWKKYINQYNGKFTITPDGRQYLQYLKVLQKAN